jgi:glycosyltransferase involved in cell wall biosynthesis
MGAVEIIGKPKLSVVIASQNALQSISKCLSEVENQRGGNEIEIIVVDNSTDGTTDIIARDFPQITLIRSPKDKLIPELWGIGIKQSVGEIVAVTTTHFVPSENWIAEIIKIHDSKYSGVGGAIENDEKASLISWAIYFCRYSRYMLPFAQISVDDFAADNASYKRVDLQHVKTAMEKGFWEVFVHKTMQQENMPLVMSPNIVVYHQESFTFSGFMKQRFQHGRQYGTIRGQSIQAYKKAILVLISPLIPFVYLYRITSRVFFKKRNVGKYLLSLPVLFFFLVSWAAGELIGYLRK